MGADVLRRLLLTAALAAAPITAAGGQTPISCERCHGSREFLSLAARGGAEIPESLVVTRSALNRDRHLGVPCSGCHTQVTGFPHDASRARIVNCARCHIAQDTLWRTSVHGTQGRGAPRAPCQACHGSHRPPIAGFMRTAEGRVAMRAACTNCHADAVQRELADVHVDSVACTRCHGEHDIRPVPDPATHDIDVALARTCSTCHPQVAETYWRDVHGTTAARQARAQAAPAQAAATCVSCHGVHGIRRASDPGWRRDVVGNCTGCHAAYGGTFADSYHGQATTVGSRAAAKCEDCHTPHNIRRTTDPLSSVSAGNRLATCRRCHTDASGRFAGYLPHANPRDRGANPLLFWVWLFMNSVLFGTMVVWGAHATIWFVRSWQERRTREAAAHAHGAKVPMDSALRGGPPYVWRFNVMFRIIHALIVVTFFVLVTTGLPLRFSCAAWAPGLMAFLGGAELAGRVHRYTGLVMFGYFGMYVVYMTLRLARAPRKLDLLHGPNSILPHVQDLRDVVAMVKYFFRKGPHPRFGRFSYMEKFDYFAETWGVLAIGFTGLMLWFPEFFGRFFPGILFNVAIIIHSWEAMIATAFIFTIHFFNVHLRPEKWPLDAVMFTGRASLEYMLEEHPLMAERIAHQVRTEPVSLKAIADKPAPPPPKWMNFMGAFIGLFLLGWGLVLIGLILWGSLC
ncbi:MAG: cytochrome b/b6 domain-containing protein [Gemmatimonadota bacterium]